MKLPSCASRPSSENTENLRWGRKALIALIVIGVIFWGWLKIRNPETFPIRTVKIMGTLVHVDHTVVRNTITPYLSYGMLWLDPHKLENSLNHISWVENAAVRRKWPDELFINITEQQPVAHWNNTALINQQGDVFSPDKQENLPVLPALYGPPHTQTTVFAGYVMMNNLLKSTGLSVAVALMTERKAWEIYLNNDLHLYLGRENVPQRLSRFIAVYPQLSGKIANMAYVDLRYTDGFAIKWKNNSATE